MFRPVVFVYDGVKSLAGKSIIATVKDKVKELEKEKKRVKQKLEILKRLMINI